MVIEDFHPPQTSGRILVTGCPRSGTKFAAQYFQERKILLEHETAGPHGTVEWRMALVRDPDFDMKISLIRHPLLTIRSLTDLMISLHLKHRTKPTWYYLNRVAHVGQFDRFILEEMWLMAAIQWWNVVYQFHLDSDYRMIRVEDLTGAPIHNHPKVNALDFDKGWVWDQVKDVAEVFGYTKRDMK